MNQRGDEDQSERDGRHEVRISRLWSSSADRSPRGRCGPLHDAVTFRPQVASMPSIASRHSSLVRTRGSATGLPSAEKNGVFLYSPLTRAFSIMPPNRHTAPNRLICAGFGSPIAYVVKTPPSDRPNDSSSE